MPRETCYGRVNEVTPAETAPPGGTVVPCHRQRWPRRKPSGCWL